MPQDHNDGSIGLLLQGDETSAPILEGHIAPEKLAELRMTRPVTNRSPYLWNEGEDRENLRAERWGVIVPQNGGNELLASIGRLLQIRAEQQGIAVSDVRVVRVSPNEPDWAKWIDENLPTTDLQRPRYLLLLGDLDQIPLDLQKELAERDYYPGRLAFDKLEHYEAYAEKVARWENAEPFEQARTVLLAARTGWSKDPPNDAHQRLLLPARLRVAELAAQGNDGYAFSIESGNDDIPVTVNDLLNIAENRDCPTVLWSVSHGYGPSFSPNKREEQGLPRFAGVNLDVKKVAEGPFLPGGFWFLFACFGAATPSRSDYWTWLSQLSALNAPELGKYDPNSAFKGLSDPGFVAAVPKAVLANPDGPLAILGHSDLAWIYSYGRFANTNLDPVNQFLRVPSRLADPNFRWRAGRAVAHFRNSTALVSRIIREFTLLEEASEREIASTVDRVQLARLMMHYHDIHNFILLGDPAVRLPIRKRSSS